jgi:hypothetical protein
MSLLVPPQSVTRVSPLASFCRLVADVVVKNDTFRTLATDTQFKGRVKEDMLIRLLEAFVWKNHGTCQIQLRYIRCSS